MAKITGREKHVATLRRLRGPAARREYGKAIFTAAGLIADEAALSITAGAVSGKNHVPSAPGEPPNADTHLLDRSIHAEKTGQLTAIAVADAPYAIPLEFGPASDPDRARPFMGPAANKKRPDAQRLVEAARDRIVRGGSL